MVGNVCDVEDSVGRIQGDASWIVEHRLCANAVGKAVVAGPHPASAGERHSDARGNGDGADERVDVLCHVDAAARIVDVDA